MSVRYNGTYGPVNLSVSVYQNCYMGEYGIVSRCADVSSASSFWFGKVCLIRLVVTRYCEHLEVLQFNSLE